MRRLDVALGPGCRADARRVPEHRRRYHDEDRGRRGIGAAGGAIIGAFTGSPGTGAAVGAALGGASGFLYDQYGRSSFAR